MNNTIEIELPKDSLIRTLVEGENKEVGEDNGITEVKETLTDEEYQTMLNGFLERLRNQQELNKPVNKLKRILEEKREQRKPAMYRGLKQGFLNRSQSSQQSHRNPSQSDS